MEDEVLWQQGNPGSGQAAVEVHVLTFPFTCSRTGMPSVAPATRSRSTRSIDLFGRFRSVWSSLGRASRGRVRAAYCGESVAGLESHSTAHIFLSAISSCHK